MISDDEISDEFVPVEDGEETTNNDIDNKDNNETNSVVEADERNGRRPNECNYG